MRCKYTLADDATYSLHNHVCVDNEYCRPRNYTHGFTFVYSPSNIAI